MAAIVADLCDAMVSRINGATLSQPFTVKRGWLELVQRQTMQAEDPISILIVPDTLGAYAFDLKPRTAMEWDIGIWIDKSIINDPLNPTVVNLETTDAVAGFVEEIVLLFAANRLLQTATVQGKCIKIEAVPVYDQQQLSELRIFRALIKTTYRVTQ